MFSLEQATDGPTADGQASDYDEENTPVSDPLPDTLPPTVPDASQTDVATQLQTAQPVDTITQSDILDMLGNFPNLLLPAQVSGPLSSDPTALTQPSPAVTSTMPGQSGTTNGPIEDLHDDPLMVHSQLATIDPSLLKASVPQTARMVTGGKAPRPGLGNAPIPGTDSPTLLHLPENAHEPIWMKKKQTLKYFRSVFKMGNLSGLISNWYRLEEALGFPIQVRFIHFRHWRDTHVRQTQKGFPTTSRPDVIAIFLKNHHNYKRDYGLEAHSLGSAISKWWREINGTAHVGFGGPTSIYTMIVLMSWWCSLLRDLSDAQRADYVVIVEELNRAVTAAIQRAKQPSDTPSSASPSSLNTPTPPPQCGRRRAKCTSPEDGPLPSGKRIKS